MTKEEAIDILERTVFVGRSIIEALDCRQKGEWEEEHLTSTSGGTFTVQRCSCCQCAVPSTPNYNYCPNCGADMRGDTK